jgi:hypothetical protein
MPEIMLVFWMFESIKRKLNLLKLRLKNADLTLLNVIFLNDLFDFFS